MKISLKQLLTQRIAPGTKFKVLRSFRGIFNSHTRNPSGTGKELPKGSIIKYQSTALNGNTWFIYKNERFCMHLMSVDGMIEYKMIKEV